MNVNQIIESLPYKLADHQIEAANYIVKNRGGFLWMAPRAGKTPSGIIGVLRIHEELNEEIYPMLIFTTNNVMESWETECDTFKLNYIALHGSTKVEEKLNKNTDIVIANYDKMQSYGLLNKKKWKVVIFDESVCIANMTTKVSKECLRWSDRLINRPIIIMMSGQPAPESPIQYVTQYMTCIGEFMGYYGVYAYLNSHWDYSMFSHKWKVKNTKYSLTPGRKHFDEIREYIQNTAYCITTEELENKGLISKKERHTISLPVSNKQLQCLKEADIKREKLNKMSTMMDDVKLVGNMVYAYYENAICAGIDPLNKTIIDTRKIRIIINRFKSNNKPILVFSPYINVLRMGMKLCKENRIKCGVIYGKIKKPMRHKIRQLFQEGKIDIVWVNSTIGKMGLDFSRSCDTYYHSNSFSLDTREQSELRTTKLGKTDTVRIYDFSTLHNGSELLDGEIQRTLNQKKKISKSILSKTFIQ